MVLPIFTGTLLWEPTHYCIPVSGKEVVISRTRNFTDSLSPLDQERKFISSNEKCLFNNEKLWMKLSFQ